MFWEGVEAAQQSERSWPPSQGTGLEGQADCMEAKLGGGGRRATLVRAGEGEVMCLCQRWDFPAKTSCCWGGVLWESTAGRVSWGAE